MTPESLIALGARLTLKRLGVPMPYVVALSDEDAVTIASAALDAQQAVNDHLGVNR